MRWRHVSVAIVAAVVVMAAPASAANVVASEHDTFGTGNQGEPAPAALDNATVQGSGASASVDFDPVPAESYNVVDDTGDGTVDSNVALGDNGASNRLSQEIVLEPAYSGEIDSLTLDVDSVTGSDYGFSVDVYLIQEQPDGDLREGTQLGTIDPDFTTGEQQFDLSTSATVDSSSEYTLELVVDSTDSDFQQDSIEIGTDSSANSEHIRLINSGGSDASLDEFADVSISQDPSQSGLYRGATHQASDIVEGEVQLTNVSNTDATITWQEDDDGDGSWTDVASQTVSSAGTYSQSLSSTDSSRWRAEVDFARTGASPTAEIEREAVITNNEAPSGSNPRPSGDIDRYDGSVELDVSDPDFQTEQGDSVTVELEQNGTTVGTKTVTSNTTVSINYDAETGTNDLNWTLTDANGLTDTVSQSFGGPIQLRIVNATSPDTLVTGQSNSVTVRFFDSSNVVRQRNTTDGTVSLDGLPAAPDGGYAVTVDSEGDYYGREVVIRSLFEQQTVYLLPTNADSSTVEFQLTDRTGRFSQPRLTVLKPVTRDFDGDNSNETRYVAASSAEFSAAQSLTTTLERGSRYRLRVTNENGATRVLGSYTPRTSSDVVDLTIAQISLGAADPEKSVIADAEIRETGGQRALRFLFEDPEANTSSLNYEVKRVDTDPNVSITNGSASDLGRTVATFNVSQYPENASFAVQYNYTRDGPTETGLERAGTLPPLGIQFLGGQVASLTGWLTIVSLTGLVVIRSPRLAAVVCAVLTSALSVLEVIAVGLVPVGIASAIALLFVISRGAGQ